VRFLCAMKTFIAVVILGAISICLTTGKTTSQQSEVPGTIRVHVSLIPIDVQVADKDGKPVLDLTKDDFTVLENGVRQDIRHFSLQAMVAMVPNPKSKLLLRKVPTLELAPQSSRTFLILLGRGRIQRPFRSVDALIRFVRKDLLPQDQVAVFAYNRATDFTTDHEQIAQVLERYKKIHEKIESRLTLLMSGLAAIYGSREIPKSMQPNINAIFQAPGAPGSREVPPGRITDSGQLSQDMRQVTDTLQRMELNSASVSPLEQMQANMLTDLPFEEFVSTNAMTMQDLQNISTSIEYLRYMDGEKHLLFFTENGLFLPRLENDKSVAAMANDARVAIDTFQTGGVYSTMSFSNPAVAPTGSRMRGSGAAVRARTPVMQGSTSRTFALSSLQNISQLTGGQSSIHGDISSALDELNEVTRSEYLLGYYPKNTDFDGRYRKITVRVNRPDVEVSFRHGYYARTILEPFDRQAFLTYSRIAAAGAYISEVRDLHFKATAKQDTSLPDKPEVQVDLLINPLAVPFQTVNELHQGRLDITIFYGDSKGRFLGDVWETLDMNLKESTYQRAMQDGIKFSVRIPMEVPDQTLKVVVYNYQNDKVGTVMIKAK
jgi:VWFA-related protein